MVTCCFRRFRPCWSCHGAISAEAPLPSRCCRCRREHNRSTVESWCIHSRADENWGTGAGGGARQTLYFTCAGWLMFAAVTSLPASGNACRPRPVGESVPPHRLDRSSTKLEHYRCPVPVCLVRGNWPCGNYAEPRCLHLLVYECAMLGTSVSQG